MKFNLYNLTKELLNEKTLNSEIFKSIPNNGKCLPRFNPGIIHLENNIYMISYRIWVDLEAENVYKYPNIYESGSPWTSNWSPYLKCFDYDNLVSDNNVQLRNYGFGKYNKASD